MSQVILAQPAPALTRFRIAGRDPGALTMAVVRSEWFALLALLLVVSCGLLVRLGSVIVGDMDEGTYVYAGKLLAEGQIPYRDFLLAHPPLLIVLLAGWQWLAGTDLMAIRLAYMATILASTVPLYAVTRTLARSRIAGLVGVAAYITGMVLLANMARTVKLEPLMNAFLIAAVACFLLRPDSLRVRFLVGMLLALAVLVKLVAVVPAALIVLGDLFWTRPGHRFVRSWAAAAAGAALVLVPAAALLLSQPNFVDDVLRSHLGRPGLPLDYRLSQLFGRAFVRYPIIPIALIAAAWLLIRGRDARLRILALVALGSTVTLVFAFRTFFGYYFVQVLPWVAIIFAAIACPLVQRVTRRWAPTLLVAGALLLGGAVPALYGEIYHRTAHDHVSSPARIVPLLREGEGYVYSMYPSFALWSGRELYPWYYVVDSLIPRITGRMGDDDFVRAFSECQALVLWPGEIADYPNARAYVERHFRIAHDDGHYTLWLRSADAG